MKKAFGALALAILLAVPSMAIAAEQTGVYVAPKFVYGLTQMDGMKFNWRDLEDGESGSDRMGSKMDSTFGGSFAIGYDFDKKFNVPMRAELEYAAFSEAEGKKTFRDVDFVSTQKQKIGIQTLFMNAYWDIHTGTAFTPYIGAGIGMAFLNTKGSLSGYDPADRVNTHERYGIGSKTRTNFAWNIGAGLGYDINDNWTMDAGYRFVGLGSVKTGTTRDSGATTSMRMKTENLYQHQFSVGVRYTF